MKRPMAMATSMLTRLAHSLLGGAIASVACALLDASWAAHEADGVAQQSSRVADALVDIGLILGQVLDLVHAICFLEAARSGWQSSRCPPGVRTKTSSRPPGVRVEASGWRGHGHAAPQHSNPRNAEHS
jgi:hypothetical protein